MNSNKINFIAKIFTVIMVCLILVSCKSATETPPLTVITAEITEPVPAKQFKVLHIMSYSADWPWNVEQFNGFKDALDGVNVEYRVFEMDAKRRNTDELVQAGEEARNLIESWNPDLIYASDDSAQEYVTRYYVGTDLPIVFSAVNADPAQYGFEGSRNVTGILEQEHFGPTLHLLKEISPTVKKVAIIVDESPMWDPVLKRMQEQQGQIPDIEIIAWDVVYTFEEYQKKVIAYQDTANALGLIGIFQFKDKNGQNVPYQDVLKWTAENSNLPDFTFWDDRIQYGTLCTVAVSGYEQGLAAGDVAREILVNDKSPSGFLMQPTEKGVPVVSLARAEKLGVTIKSSILLTARVITAFKWDE